jgi:hypothetical protein
MSGDPKGRPLDGGVRFHRGEEEMDYLNLLQHSFAVEKANRECAPASRLAYLSDSIFDFTTYDSAMDELFAAKAIEVCAAINDSKTFEYIKDAEQYKWYLLMCNMPFFAERLEWGTSIRGAWWAGQLGKQIEFDTCGLWIGDDQCIETLKFSADDWRLFIAAVIYFAGGK